MATWEDLDNTSSEDEDETNLCQMANLPSDSNSEDEVTTSHYLELREAFDDLLRDSSILSAEYKTLK